MNIDVIYNPPKSDWEKLSERVLFDTSTLDAKVAAILAEIKKDGDTAVRKFTKLFDKVEVSNLLVEDEEVEEALSLVSESLYKSILKAASNIEKFHAAQYPKPVEVETMPGVKCIQKPMPIQKVGLYIPGGTAPLFSTVLMLALPAKIAGCEEIILCTPPNTEGKIHPAILAAAKVSGITKIYKIGGVQAIASMAYGTATVPKVYKIFGPGNQFVTAAKRLVSIDQTAIDMPAGPSEVQVIADANSDASFVASDLLSQAEHGVDSQSILLTDSKAIVEPVLKELKAQLNLLPRKDLAEKALENSRIIILNNKDEVMEFTNLYAPEHLIISTDDYNELAAKVCNAGSVFLGKYTPESAGDYASGTNHTLPTYGYAKMYSGVNIDSYLKKITYQEISKEGLKQIGPIVEELAAAEYLEAHKNAVTLRLKSL